LVDFRCEQRDPDDVRELALIGSHAERRVAFQVLDRAIPFACGEGDIGNGHVVPAGRRSTCRPCGMMQRARSAAADWT
jgi:hypothetical protein